MAQPLLNKVHRDIGNVDADPFTAEADGRVDRRTAATERIEDYIGFFAAGADYPF